MTGKILEGKILAATLQNELREKINQCVHQGNRPPGLAVILIGEDPASTLYVRNKHKTCQAVGILSRSYHLESSIPEANLLNLIDELNLDETIDGILVQLPVPSHIEKNKVIEKIYPHKDVDGFHPYNLGRLAQKRPLFRPCTPAGIMSLLNTTQQPLIGLDATIVGISNIVGRPMLLELLMAGCTVTACHRFTKDLQCHVIKADILVVAAGHPHLIPGSWIKKGAIVIDVGMNRLNDGGFVGDVVFHEAIQNASWITPVPGGVGPMTVITLLNNTFYAYQRTHLNMKDTNGT